MPLGALVPIIAGALGAGSSIWGQHQANKANSAQAQRQMDFQERMSNTSAQRAVKDYRAAGLNPALAYDRPASSPGGASAVIGNVMDGAVSQGLSSARAARDWKADTEAKYLANRRAQGEIQALQASKAAQEASGQLATENARKVAQDRVFQLQLQPHLQRAQELQNALTAAQIPGAQAQAKFDQRLGEWGPGLKFLLNGAKGVKSVIP